MSANLVLLKSKPAEPELPSDFPGILRRLAIEVEEGRVTQFVGMYVRDNTYSTLIPSSIGDTITLSALLHDFAIKKFYVPE